MYANPDYNIFVWQHTFLEQSNCYLKSICKPKNEIKQNKTKQTTTKTIPLPKKSTSTKNKTTTTTIDSKHLIQSFTVIIKLLL